MPLPRDLPPTTAPAVAVLAHTEMDLPHLSRLLHLSAGVVRTREWRPGQTFLFRAAGSAGGRFPLELYVAVPDGSLVPPGVHWYDPQDHALVLVGPPPRGGAPAVVVTGVPWRTGWKYRERGYRHVYWDAGTMLAQLLAVADSAGLTASLHIRFPDAAVAALVGADGVHEWPVAVVALGDGAPALDATGSAAAGEVDAAPVEFPLVTTAQRAEGRLHLLACALGASASGMSFCDSEVPTLLGERLDALLFTCVGVPEYTPAPGGPPGAPTAFRMVPPRVSAATMTKPERNDRM